MIVVPPISFNETSLTSSISEPDTSVGEAVWVSGTTYAALEEVILVSTHKKYKRLIAGAGTIPPNLDLDNWIEAGPTNRWAMFDLHNTTTSNTSASLSVDIVLPDRINTVVIIGANLQDLTVTLTDSVSSTIYSKSISMISREVYDYYSYFFADFVYQESLLLQNIPPILNGTLHLSSDYPGSISAVVMGTSQLLGFTQKEHSNTALNFSLLEKDDFGNSVLIPRRSIPKTTQSLIVPKQKVPKVIGIRKALNAKPAVWAGLTNSDEKYFNSLLILGVYKEFTLNLNYHEYATCTLELEEL